jgi:hypothetical protein
MPTLVLYGGANPQALRTAARALAGALSDARLKELVGQGHDIVPEVVAPAVRDFLGDSGQASIPRYVPGVDE